MTDASNPNRPEFGTQPGANQPPKPAAPGEVVTPPMPTAYPTAGAQQPYPGAQQPYPGGQPQYPGGSPAYPGAQTPNYGAQPQPGHPAAPHGYPGQYPSNPGVQTPNYGGQTYPNAQPTYPGSQYPGTQLAFPNAQNPNAQPAYPGAQPAYPNAQYPNPQHPTAQHPGYAQQANGYRGPDGVKYSLAGVPRFPGTYIAAFVILGIGLMFGIMVLTENFRQFDLVTAGLPESHEYVVKLRLIIGGTIATFVLNIVAFIGIVTSRSWGRILYPAVMVASLIYVIAIVSDLPGGADALAAQGRNSVLPIMVIVFLWLPNATAYLKAMKAHRARRAAPATF